MSYNTVSSGDFVSSLDYESFSDSLFDRLDDIIFFLSPEDNIQPFAVESYFVMPSTQIMDYVSGLVVGSGYDYYIFDYTSTSDWILYVFDDFSGNIIPFESSFVVIDSGRRYTRYTSSNIARLESVNVSSLSVGISMTSFTNVSDGFPVLDGLDYQVDLFSYSTRYAPLAVVIFLVFVIGFFFRRFSYG